MCVKCEKSVFLVPQLCFKYMSSMSILGQVCQVSQVFVKCVLSVSSMRLVCQVCDKCLFNV